MSASAAAFGARPNRASWLLPFDPYLLATALLLICYGLAITYAITIEDRAFSGDIVAPMARAFLLAGLATLAMLATALLDYEWLGRLAPLLYVVALASLAIVLAIGNSTFGATRWVTLAGFKFQPSEFAKVLMIIVLARYFADRIASGGLASIGSPLAMLGGLALLAPAVALVFRQPDLGTSLVFVTIFFGIAFMAGTRLWQLTALVATGIAALPVAWGLLKDYQRARLSAFLDPQSDPQGAGWNIIQSLIAVGSGQATGKGLTAGTQSPLGYLPIAESDFAFAGLAEDLGFVGALILFLLYAVLMFAALRIGFRARDPFGMLLAVGVVTMLLFQLFVNVGMAVALMPVTGIPLPFISQGGSSLVATCLALGVLHSVAARRNIGDSPGRI